MEKEGGCWVKWHEVKTRVKMNGGNNLSRVVNRRMERYVLL